MDGVTILNEFEVATRTSDSLNLGIMAVTLITMIICSAVVGFFIADQKFEGVVLGALFGIIIGTFIGLLLGGVFAASSTDTTTRYEVSIDDNVSMNEFLEHYTIIEQRGKIFVVEKNDS